MKRCPLLIIGYALSASRICTGLSEVFLEVLERPPMVIAMKKKFAEILRDLMRERRVTAKEISSKTGISQSTLSEWLGSRTPRFSEDVLKVAHFFGVSLEYLLNGATSEEGIVNEVIGNGTDFVSVHSGLYKIHIEKFVGKKKGGRTED